MVWKADNPEGNEAGKVRFDLVPYMQGCILDLGCGQHKVFPIAIGVDNRIDARLFGIQIKPDVAVDTCERMPLFGNESADTIFSSHLLEHIADYRSALKEWWRILKTGGHLILYLPDEDEYPKVGEAGANPDHKWNVSYARVIEAMESVGAWDLIEFEKRNHDMEYSLLFVFKKLAAGRSLSYARKPPKPEKTLGIVRLGAFGDALWASSLFAHFAREGYHITLYTQTQGEQALRHDPNINRIICQPQGLFDFGDLPTGVWQTAYWIHEARARLLAAG
jgi:predicted SAM-dependent methyltransferase